MHLNSMMASDTSIRKRQRQCRVLSEEEEYANGCIGIGITPASRPLHFKTGRSEIIKSIDGIHVPISSVCNQSQTIYRRRSSSTPSLAVRITLVCLLLTTILNSQAQKFSEDTIEDDDAPYFLKNQDRLFDDHGGPADSSSDDVGSNNSKGRQQAISSNRQQSQQRPQRNARVGNEYKYVPRWMSSKSCWNLSYEDCRQADMVAKDSAMKLRQIISPHRYSSPANPGNGDHNDNDKAASHEKRGVTDDRKEPTMATNRPIAESDHDSRNLHNKDEVKVGNSGATSSSAAEKNRQLLNDDDSIQRHLQDSAGTLKALVLLMEWPNHRDDARDLLPPENYDALFNADDVDDDLYPTGSIKRYFDVNSYGRAQFEADIVPWQQAEDDEAVYSSFGTNAAFARSFVPILERLDNDGINFGDYDQDNDGIIDLIIVVHSGYAAEIPGIDCYSGATSNQRINSFQTSATETFPWTSNEGFRVGPFVTGSAYRMTCNSNIARLGTLTHEIGHAFGLPDLYDIEGALNPETGAIGGIGRFGLMSNPSGQRNNFSRPGHLTAWSKSDLGWIDPIVITEDGTYKAPPVELESVAYRIDHPNFLFGEYLLLENRQPIPGDFDENFWEPGGMIIYHIDENNFNIAGDGNSPRGGPFQDGWPGNGNHYPVAVMQRDGLYELEQSLNGGDENDFYYLPEHSIGPGNGELVANSAPYPNTDAYGFGSINPTGIVINNFREIEGGVMCFDVSGLGSSQPSTKPSSTPTTTPSALPTQAPTGIRSDAPSLLPSASPTQAPTIQPSALPSHQPSEPTSVNPSAELSTRPSATPTVSEQSSAPSPSETSVTPSQDPSSASATTQPSMQPSQIPSIAPSSTVTVSISPSGIVSPTTSPIPVTNRPTEATDATKAPFLFPSLILPEYSTISPAKQFPTPQLGGKGGTKSSKRRSSSTSTSSGGSSSSTKSSYASEHEHRPPLFSAPILLSDSNEKQQQQLGALTNEDPADDDGKGHGSDVESTQYDEIGTGIINSQRPRSSFEEAASTARRSYSRPAFKDSQRFLLQTEIGRRQRNAMVFRQQGQRKEPTPKEQRKGRRTK